MGFLGLSGIDLEDSAHSIIGRGVGPDGTRGPSAAIQAYLATKPGFTIDRAYEPTLTWSPNGYLLKGGNA